MNRVEETAPEFMITAMGLVSASVCSSLPIDEVERRMGLELTGVGPWMLADEPTFADGRPNPCPCEAFPNTNTHYLFHC